MSHINFLSQKLVDKEKKIGELRDLSKKDKIEIAEAKRLKKENENKVDKAIKENGKLNKEMMDMQKKYEKIVKENKLLLEKQVVLENKISILQKVSCDLTDSQNHTVMVESNCSQTINCEQCPKMEKKIEKIKKKVNLVDMSQCDTTTSGTSLHLYSEKFAEMSKLNLSYYQ